MKNKISLTLAAQVRTTLVLAILTVLSACGGSSDGGSDNSQPAERTYADFTMAAVQARSCPELSFSVLNGAPLDMITVGGLPEDFESIAIYITPQGLQEDLGILFPAGEVTERSAEFAAPIPFDGELDGTLVDLVVTDGDDYCPAISFAIDGLPPAPADITGYLNDFVDEFQRYQDLLAQSLGSSYDELAALDAPPEDGLLPLYLSIDLLDSLFPQQLADLNAFEQELLARLLVQQGALDALSESADSINDWLLQNVPQPLASVAGTTLSMGSGFGSVQASAAGGDCKIIQPERYEIGSTAELSRIMSNPAQAQADSVLNAVGTGSAIAGIVSGPAGALAQKGGAVAKGAGALGTAGGMLGLLGTAAKLANEAAKAESPSVFTSFSFDIDGLIYEDRQAPYEAHWSNAQANVENTPFSITRQAADVALTLAGAVPVAGWSIGVLGFAYQNEINTQLDKLNDYDGLGCVSIDKQSWGPFDLTDSQWTTVEILGGSVVQGGSHTGFSAAQLGQSEIQVRVKGERFGGASILANNFATVNAKTVSISPGSPRVTKPGEEVTLQASINAFLPEGQIFTPPAGAGEVTHTYLGGGQHRYVFASPESEKLYPAPFKVRSTTPEVPPNSFEREDTVQIKLDADIEIKGAIDCVQPNQQVELEAVLNGFKEPDNAIVDWTATRGSMDTGSPTRQATFMAPGTEGVVTVKASTKDPRPEVSEPLTDEVEMNVSRSCIQQFFAAELQSTADGDPDCTGPLGDRDDAGGFPDDIEQLNDIEELNVPRPSAAYFNDRNETLTTESSFISSEIAIATPQNRCETTLPSGYGQLNISTRSDGTAHWDVTINDSGTCYTDDFGRECNLGVTQAFLNHYMYIPITEAGTYQLTVDMACTELPMFGVQILVSRYIDSQGDITQGEITAPNGVDPDTGAGNLPWINPNQTLKLVCADAALRDTLTFELLGPLGTSGEDLLVLNYFASPFAPGALTVPEYIENLNFLVPAENDNEPQFQYEYAMDLELKRID